ncbi:choice-of-anchor M domain-containing protein [Corynebacterium timonense]|uniref:Surface-anchored protein n=1 Tax=Corynebacterium timonense TaxID=441500 RepID=A0A1H1PW03_9CORY|nr:choice-of-anchor M domain-containing protein [Corynebacterium timonense]SDS15303.1 surface-anchored protein [Corynebacterium timonense]
MGTSRTARRATAVVTALFLLTPVTAVAGPDDGKAIATRTHVDAPKTFWTGDAFTLKTSYGENTVKNVDETAIWTGKGWGLNSNSQYQFTVPDDPQFRFLGQPGDVLYAAPNITHGNNDPVWLGFGASDLPTEKFRDNTVSLDLVSVDGPGRVEKFIWRRDNAPVERLLSSSDGPRSYFLTSGDHTHNFTTFSRPGRYELTYRTVARDHNGTIISSELTTLPIQVGGKQPHDTPTPSTKERYNNAPEGNLADAGYTLSVAPNETHEKDGDEHLSTLTFTAKDTSLEGTLTLFINGYFLTDLDVTKGTASWNEHLGPLDSTLQAVFTPKGTTGARWISPPLPYATGATNTVTSDHGNAKLTEPTNDPANTVLPTKDYTPTTLNYTATIEPAGKGKGKVTVEFEDKRIRGFLRGGLYDKKDDEFASVAFEGTVENGRAEYVFETYDDFNGATARLEVVPHPTVAASTGVLTMPAPYSVSTTLTAEGALGAAGSQPKPTPSPDPEVCTPRPVIERGHVDIAATGGKTDLGIVLKDDTNTTPGVKERRLDSVVLGVHNNARKERKGAFSDPFFDVVGPKDSPFYLLPATQNPDIIWPGYNTQNIDYEGIDGTVDLHIDIADGPKNGHLVMFQDEFGGYTPYSTPKTATPPSTSAAPPTSTPTGSSPNPAPTPSTSGTPPAQKTAKTSRPKYKRQPSPSATTPSPPQKTPATAPPPRHSPPPHHSPTPTTTTELTQAPQGNPATSPAAPRSTRTP